MCLLISQTNNTPIKRDLLENADCSNPDGMGFAYAVNGEIKIEKFREFKPFYKAYSKAVKRHGTVTDFILHFRMSTHGVNAGLFNVHPFRVNERLAFAHNGILDVDNDKKKSDTQVFNETILRKLKPNFLNNTAVCSLIEGFIGSDKLVFLDSDGKSTILNESNGHWKAGVWYSNSSYKTYTPTTYGWNYGTYVKPYKKPTVKKSKTSVSGTCEWCCAWGDLIEINKHGKRSYLCNTCNTYNV
tara:strand:+ start:293 stop:1021 length:729 start_codon:yes stop_codon:yes gene_type:complete